MCSKTHPLSHESYAFKEVHDVFAAGLRFRQEFPPDAQCSLSGNSLCRKGESCLQGCWAAPPSPFLSIPPQGTPACHRGPEEKKSGSSRLLPGSLGLSFTPQRGPGRGGHPAWMEIWDQHPQWQHGPAAPGLCHAGGGPTLTTGAASGEAFLVLPGILSDTSAGGIWGFKSPTSWHLGTTVWAKAGAGSPQDLGLCLESNQSVSALKGRVLAFS